MIRQLIVPLAVAVVTFHAGQASAQGAFPAPLPGKGGTASDAAFPPVNGAAPAPSFGGAPASFPGSAPMASSPFAAPPTQSGAVDECMKEFMPLRQEAEKRGALLKAAGDKHAGADVACKLIGNFIQSELKMIKYVETNGPRCQIPPQIADLDIPADIGAGDEFNSLFLHDLHPTCQLAGQHFVLPQFVECH